MRSITSISDVCLAFPGLVFALAMWPARRRLDNAVFALAVISWPSMPGLQEVRLWRKRIQII